MFAKKKRHRMKRSKLTITILITIGSFIAGYKGKPFIQQSIYLPLRTFLNLTPVSDSPLTVRDYTPTGCPKSAITIATFGQSNSANHVDKKYSGKIPKTLYQYDWKSRKCYHYKEPLLGTDGFSGSIITYTALALSKEKQLPVIVAPFGESGSSILSWAYGSLSLRHNLVLDRIKQDGLSPKVFFWHQGESDSHTYELKALSSNEYFKASDYGGLTKEQYSNSLQIILDKTKSRFPNSYFGIAKASICGNRPRNEQIRESQSESALRNKQGFVSADTDKFTGNANRPDGCHFSSDAAERIGLEYFDSYTAKESARQSP